MSINVLIADDHKMVSEGLKQLLEITGRIKVTGIVSNGQECLEHISHRQPDVVLLDINMPVIDGITTLKMIKKRNYKCKVILLTIHNEPEYIIRCNELECDGYVLKDSDSVTLENAILSVYNGERYIEPELVVAMNNALVNREYNYDKLDSLSSREISVLKLIAKGLTNKEIAEKLDISDRTVKNHVSNIFKKIDINDRTQAAVFAIKHNLIEIK